MQKAFVFNIILFVIIVDSLFAMIETYVSKTLNIRIIKSVHFQ